jgi:hypothetical protein
LRSCCVGITGGRDRDVKYAVEMASGVMMEIQSFVKIGTGVQKLSGGYTYRHTDKKVIL